MAKQEHKVNRRGFMKDAAAVGLGAAAAAGTGRKAHAKAYKSILPQTVLGANEKIRTGHIGTGGMGSSNLGFVLQRDDMQPIAVCDIWYRNKEKAAAMVGQKFDEPTKHHDFREVIDNKDVDAVVIATPDHWHAMPTIAACDAGKHVWCEKPLCTTIEEGRAMVNAARRNNTVIQCGTMQRSGPAFQEAVQLVRDGYIGKIARVETWIHDAMPIEGLGPARTTPPPQCDWEMHQGWTEHVPFNEHRWLYNFRWFLDYSGGKLTDWGAHLIDIAVWAMGQEKQPKAVTAMGGNYVITDNRTTPDTLDVLWEYDDFVMSFQNRVWSPQAPGIGNSHGILFHGTLGTLRADRGGYEVTPSDANEGCEPKKRGGDGSLMNINHWQNFVDCIKSGERCIADVEDCHNTTRTCHMGTCSYVAGARLEWDVETEKFSGGDTEAVKKANEFAYRPYNNGWTLG